MQDAAPDLITLSLHDYRIELAQDVREGLTAPTKSLPSKYFYDARGGALFERITELPEYYLTRAEMAALRKHSAEIVALTSCSEVLELGSGSADKISVMLEQAPAHAIETYCAIDVNPYALQKAGNAFQRRNPGIETIGFVGDFVTDLNKIPPTARQRLVTFFGSTIGNLNESERASFFKDVSQLLRSGDHFLLGVDLVKSRNVLRAAYDDREGITSEFTLNILTVLNRELDANFDVVRFEHVPRWNETHLRMEAWLRASTTMTITIGKLNLEISFEAGEEMLTEVSCKFTRAMIDAELRSAQLSLNHWYTDADQPGTGTFALALASRI